MFKKIVSFALVLTILFSVVVNTQFKALVGYVTSNETLTSQESQVVALLNGTNAYNYDLELEKLTLNNSISNYGFRAGGSAGASAAAMWLKERFERFGLETRLESFQFTNWNLLSQPSLLIDEDGDNITTNDQTQLSSFQSEHYSWPTPEVGVFADLVVLPLPPASRFSEVGSNPINTSLWNTINTHNKIVLTGREVRWNSGWEQQYWAKLSAQPPAAVVYTWWYDWMSFAPPFFSSIGGRPVSNWGPYYWNLKIPVGWVNYQDGLLIRDRESSSNVSAKAVIQSVIDSGPHYNVIGRLQGSNNSDRIVIISGHYDSVMTPGFGDNGAGTSGVLELARVFSDAARNGVYKPDHTFLFIGFASEELGLVGSANYVWQHKAEMSYIDAVINLDSFGTGSTLSVTRTNSKQGFDLDELGLEAARDLNVSATYMEPGGSDQETFRSPSGADSTFSAWWPGQTPGISDATPVESSAMLISFPLLYSDEWNRGEPGWIHTPYDNSTSTQTLGWIEPDDLEEHIKVAALSAMRISPSGQEAAESSPFPWWTLGATVAVAVATFTVVYFAKMRKRPVKDVVQ